MATVINKPYTHNQLPLLPHHLHQHQQQHNLHHHHSIKIAQHILILQQLLITLIYLYPLAMIKNILLFMLCMGIGCSRKTAIMLD